MKFVEEYVPTIVIDNFFETPSLVINLAKQQKYWRCYDHPNKGNWLEKGQNFLIQLTLYFTKSYVVK